MLTIEHAPGVNMPLAVEIPVAVEAPVIETPADAVGSIVTYMRAMQAEHGEGFRDAIDVHRAEVLIGSMTKEDWDLHYKRGMDYGATKDAEKRKPEFHEELFAVEGLLRALGQ